MIKDIKPNPFVIIIDNYGDAVDNLSANSTIDYILDVVRIMDKKYPVDAPHSAFKWDGNQFIKIKDIEVKDEKLLSSRPVKSLKVKK